MTLPHLRLGAADRERLGAPEELPIDLDRLTNREAIQLRVLGYNTPRLFRKALMGKRLDDDGNEVRGSAEDVKLAYEGGRVVDFELDYEAWTALVWLALRRAGVNVDAKTLEFDVEECAYVGDPEPEAPKAPNPSEDPEVSET